MSVARARRRREPREWRKRRRERRAWESGGSGDGHIVRDFGANLGTFEFLIGAIHLINCLGRMWDSHFNGGFWLGLEWVLIANRVFIFQLNITLSSDFDEWQPLLLHYLTIWVLLRTPLFIELHWDGDCGLGTRHKETRSFLKGEPKQ